MKKVLSMLLIFMLLLPTVFLAGCERVDTQSGGKDQTTPSVDSSKKDAAETVKVSEEQAASTTQEPITIRFFVGGDPGDAFGSIVYKGAQDAEKLLDGKVKVDYIFSGWQSEKMVSQLREAIAAKPDGICMMGHPGDDAIMPLAEEATKAGIIMMYQNVDLPTVRDKFGGGYIGVIDQTTQGRVLANQAIKQFDLKSGDRVLVFGGWGHPGRYLREEGSAKAFEDAGLIVDRVVSPPETAADPQQLLPLVTGQLTAHPETKLVLFPGSQQLSISGVYMDAVDKKPGEVKCIGFDLSPAILDGFEKGYIQLTSDQQPYLQGFLPIISVYLTKTFALSPLIFDTGAGLVDENNFADVREYVELGYR